MAIEFDLIKICLGLKGTDLEKYLMTFIPESQQDGDIAPCSKGGKVPEGEIVSDSYIARKSVAVEIKCEGCTLCPTGFKVKMRKSI